MQQNAAGARSVAFCAMFGVPVGILSAVLVLVPSVSFFGAVAGVPSCMTFSGSLWLFVACCCMCTLWGSVVVVCAGVFPRDNFCNDSRSGERFRSDRPIYGFIFRKQ